MARTHSIKTVCRSCGTMTYEYRERLYVPIEALSSSPRPHRRDMPLTA